MTVILIRSTIYENEALKGIFMALEGFEIFEFVVGTPTLSVTKNGVAFNKTTVEKLRKPETVLPLINKSSAQVAIKPCEYIDNGAQRFFREGNKVANGVRWNNKDLLDTISKMMKWNLDNGGYKVKGTYFEDENAIVFDLRKAEPLIKNQEGSNNRQWVPGEF